MALSRTSSSLELFVPIDRDDARPLHQPARAAAPGGRSLRTHGPGQPTALHAVPWRPSSAWLGASSWRPTRSSRRRAISSRGRAARPGWHACPRGRRHRLRRRDPRRVEFDFRPGRPDVTRVPGRTWSRSLRRVLDEAPADRLGYLDGHGVPELREALSAYLDRVRGTCTRARDIVICNGYAQGLRLVARRAARDRRPSRRGRGPLERRVPAHAGAIPAWRSCPSPWTTAASRSSALTQARVDAVVLTPAHQYPTGAVLAPERRAALIDWADDHGGDHRRGRLRRRVPLRPRAHRGHAGPLLRARHLRRHGQQDPGPRPAARLAGGPAPAP